MCVLYRFIGCVQEVELLGGTVTTVWRGATHLVARSVARTVKFLTGLSVVKHVVSPEWIERSAQAGCFLSEDNLHNVFT